MFEGLRRYFRTRYINRYLRNKTGSMLPDVRKFPSVTILTDSPSSDDIKAFRKAAEMYLKTKRCSVVVYGKEFPNALDGCVTVTLDDFNFRGLFNAEKSIALDSLASDMFVDLSRHETENLEIEYIAAFFKSNFKITFKQTRFGQIYDLCIDSKRDDNAVSRLEILSRYLNVLNGNEK